MSPRYTLRQLAYFVGAAEAGTAAGAAETFVMTQSAMSAALTDLEKAIDTQLFVRRRGRGLELTSGGLAFLPHARRLLRNAEELDQLALSLQESLSGMLSLGCFEAMSPAVLPPLVVELGSAFPGLRLDIRLDPQDALVNSVLSGELELALVYDFELPPEMAVDRVAEAVAHALLPADHPRASQHQISVTELQDTPLIAVTTPPAPAFAQAFHVIGNKLSPDLELANFDLIRSLVHAGQGYTIFAQPLGGNPPHWSRGVVAVPISDPVPPLTIVLIHRHGGQLTRRAGAFRHLCLTRGEELLSAAH